MRSGNAKVRVPVLMQHVGLMCSGSMEPAFYRGDLLFLTNPANQRYQTGDITVYKIPGADIPIVHRVLETHDLAAKDKGCVVRSTCSYASRRAVPRFPRAGDLYCWSSSS